MPDDPKYHDHRESQEYRLAEASSNPVIERLHRTLAEKHAKFAGALRQTAKLRAILTRDGA